MACAILAIACKNNQDNGWFTMDYTNWIGTHRFLTRKSVISWPTINNNDHVGFVFSTMKVELFPGLDSLLERNYLWQRRNLNMSLFGDDRFTKQSISHVTIFIDFLFFYLFLVALSRLSPTLVFHVWRVPDQGQCSCLHVYVVWLVLVSDHYTFRR